MENFEHSRSVELTLCVVLVCLQGVINAKNGPAQLVESCDSLSGAQPQEMGLLVGYGGPCDCSAPNASNFLPVDVYRRRFEPLGPIAQRMVRISAGTSGNAAKVDIALPKKMQLVPYAGLDIAARLVPSLCNALVNLRRAWHCAFRRAVSTVR